MRKQRYLAMALAAVMLLAGCGSANSKMADMENGAFTTDTALLYDSAEEIYTETGEMESGSTALTEEQGNARAGRKLIKTANLSVETLEFDSLLTYIENKTNELGGYVENMDVYNGSSYSRYGYSGTGYRRDRNASLTLRIPSDKLDGFLTYVEENGNIVSRSEREVDVTLDYVDLESHKKTLLTEQDRLLELLTVAETLEDIITLESRLSDVRYQIESMESRLRTYDNQITYSTIYLDISEVVELTPVEPEEQTVWQRMSEGFADSLTSIGNGVKEFFVWFVVSLPYLLLIALVVFCIVRVIMHISKKQNAKRDRRLAALGMQQPYRVPGGAGAPQNAGMIPVQPDAEQKPPAAEEKSAEQE